MTTFNSLDLLKLPKPDALSDHVLLQASLIFLTRWVSVKLRCKDQTLNSTKQIFLSNANLQAFGSFSFCHGI